MNGPDSSLIEIVEYEGASYRPLVDYDAWRVALMNGLGTRRLEEIERFNKHTETDEVFVLLRGRCILFVASGGHEVEHIEAVDLEPYKLYNVKRSVWHNHVLSDDAKVLVVENRNTVAENSPGCPLSGPQKQRLRELKAGLWG